MKRYTRTIKFNKGDEYHLDQIYAIQGLTDNIDNCNWWEHVEGTSMERVVITKNITIQINIWID